MKQKEQEHLQNSDGCYVLLACFSFLCSFFPFLPFFPSFPLLKIYWFFSMYSVLLWFCSCRSILLLSALFCVMSVVPPCPISSYSSFSLLVSELQSPSTQLCVLNHGVKLTRNAGREHFREQSLAASHLLLVHSQLEQRKWKQHILKRAENSWCVWLSF